MEGSLKSLWERSCNSIKNNSPRLMSQDEDVFSSSLTESEQSEHSEHSEHNEHQYLHPHDNHYLNCMGSPLVHSITDNLKRHSSLKVGRGCSSSQYPHGTLTPPMPGQVHFTHVSEMTRHLSLTKLKDITTAFLRRGSREITFTVPPSVSPLSPRRGIGDMGFLSPMSPRRIGPDELTSNPGSDYGGDSRATTPSPFSMTEISSFSGACSIGSINPDLYKLEDLENDLESYPEDHLGRVWFQIEYEAEAEKLKVTLLKAKNLPSRTTGAANCCDPFVRLHLMPDERRCLQTKVKRKTCNPRFEEVFIFQITAKELEERALKLTFYDVIRDKKHQIIGHVLYLLKDFSESESQKILKMDLTKDVAISPLEVGELQVSMCYNDNLERLTVTVGDIRNLKFPDNIRQCHLEYQCRVSLLHQTKVIKTKKTEVVRTDKWPSFNESFIFKVTSDQLDVSAISISLHGNKKSDSSLGRILLGSFMFARGRANEHWSEMLSRRREYIQRWHSIS